MWYLKLWGILCLNENMEVLKNHLLFLKIKVTLTGVNTMYLHTLNFPYCY